MQELTNQVDIVKSHSENNILMLLLLFCLVMIRKDWAEKYVKLESK